MVIFLSDFARLKSCAYFNVQLIARIFELIQVVKDFEDCTSITKDLLLT